MYHGALIDPLNGNEIAQVQGVELVRCLAVTDATMTQRERYQRRCADLACADAIGGGGAGAGGGGGDAASSSPPAVFEYAGTLLSRKLFCYTTPSTSTSSSLTTSSSTTATTSTSAAPSSQLLRKVRLRPTSPERTIPLSQAAAVYDTATTYCQLRPPSTTTSTSSTTPPVQWLVHTEHPDGRTIWGLTKVQLPEGAAEPTSSVSSAATHRHPPKLEFNVYARPPPLWRPKFDWNRILTEASLSYSATSSSQSVVTTSPPRSKWIQIGGGGGSSSSSQEVGKFGARETYQYTMLNQHTSKPSCFVKYTRYGEGPLWYGPGRMCTLELTGKRVEHWNELPQQVAKVAYERVVGFLSVNSPIPQDDALAKRTVEWFRGKGASKLQIAPMDSRDSDNVRGSGGGPAGLLWRDASDRAALFWERWRGATAVSHGGGGTTSRSRSSRSTAVPSSGRRAAATNYQRSSSNAQSSSRKSQ